MTSTSPTAVHVQRYAWAAILLAGLGLFEAVREVLVATGNEALVPSLVFVGAIVMPGTFVAFLAGRRMGETVSSATLVLVALGGGVVGVVIAGFVEFETLQHLGTFAKLGVAVIEEVATLLIPAVMLLRDHSRSPADGLLLGVASGAGFAALETMGYAFTTIVNSHGDLSTVSQLLLVRGVWSPAGHMAWTGLTAAALYAAARQRFSGRSVLQLTVTFAASVALHTAWDSLQTPWAYAVLAVTALGALAFIVHRQQLESQQPPLHLQVHGESVNTITGDAPASTDNQERKSPHVLH